MKTTTLIKAAAVAGMTGAAAAATVPFEYDFNTGSVLPAGFTIGSYNGVYGTAADCDGRCAQFSNNEILFLSYAGPGTFSIDSFWFNGKDGRKDSGAVRFSATLGGLATATPATESNTGNTFTKATVNQSGLTTFYIENVGGGSARVDDILGSITVPEVPLPAAGFLLAGGLGALGAARKRRKS